MSKKSDDVKVESRHNGGIINSLLPGGHEYTATATDSDGNEATAGGHTRAEAEQAATNKVNNR